MAEHKHRHHHHHHHHHHQKPKETADENSDAAQQATVESLDAKTSCWTYVYGNVPEGATVQFDGEQVGPFSQGRDVGKALLPGAHTMAIKKMGYAPFLDVIHVKPGQQTQGFEIDLVPVAGSLSVLSEAGAHVYLDGQYKGDVGEKSAFNCEMDVGARAVEVKKQGRSYFENVLAVAGKITMVDALPLEAPGDERNHYEGEFAAAKQKPAQTVDPAQKDSDKK